MTATDARPSTGAPATTRGFRPDIEGLRSVAIGLVLVYHAGFSRFIPAGFVGVDVFFVISGFLITGLLVAELERTGRVSLPRFYARRAKRLLPATAVVLVATAFLAWRFLPVTDRETFGGDIVGAALYFVNWVFAGRSVDYLAEGVGPSPVLHFWSLAVEEQFYVVWPLLLVVVGLVVRRSARARVRPVMGAGLVLIAIPSFLWSLHLTSTSPETAFFVTTTRLWELAVGAAVAIGVTQWSRLPAVVGAVLGWTGLAAIAAAGLLFSTVTAWPGAAALLPTLGTALVIISGTRGSRGGPAALLSLPLLVWIGGLSYSLYLWHWPLVVVAQDRWGTLGAWRGVLVILLAFIPAWLSLKLVENPIRFSEALARSPRLALSLGGNFTAVGAVAGLVLIMLVPSAGAPSMQSGSIGAEVLAEDPEGDQAGAPVDIVEFITPEPLDATKDVPALYDLGCQVGPETDQVKPCFFGDPDGDVTLAVVGDSKMGQWQSPLAEIAEEQGWRMTLYLKSSCPFSDSAVFRDGAPFETCARWNENLTEILAADPPDVVLTSHGGQVGFPVGSTDSDPDPEIASSDHMVAGMVSRWQTVTDLGSRVIVLLDNPHPEGTSQQSVYECVAENREALTTCAFERADGIRRSSHDEQLAAVDQVGDSVDVVDLTSVICPTERCAAVIGNVLVYRQGSHLTDSYVRSARSRLEASLVPLVQAATVGE